MQNQIQIIESQFREDIAKIHSPTNLEELRTKYLSKKHGIITDLMGNLPSLTADEKKVIGPMLNTLKKEIESSIDRKTIELANSFLKQTSDLTIPSTAQNIGHLHPTTQIIREMNKFFRYHGFSVGEGSEVEEVEYNFRRLNLPEGHPANDLQDSLYVHAPNILLRTQTSSIETRILSNNKPPLRVVAPGKCYRNETNSSTNSSFFYQYQGFVVDKGITIQHLKDTLTKFHQFLFGDDVVLRFRYKYYPEVTPGMGVDMQCRFCMGKGCQVCKYRGFIEVLGSGMIHPNTLKACGIDPEIYTGFAFGMGLDRLVMSKFGISDIRKLYGGEIVYK